MRPSKHSWDNTDMGFAGPSVVIKVSHPLCKIVLMKVEVCFHCQTGLFGTVGTTLRGPVFAAFPEGVFCGSAQRGPNPNTGLAGGETVV